MEELKKVFWRIDNEAMQFLATKLSESDKQASHQFEELLVDLQALTQSRLVDGKDLLIELLNSGEITVLDAAITKSVKAGKVDPAFVMVLDMNIEDAQKEGGEDTSRLQVLSHIYTRVQEELEKRQKPAFGLMHKLLRMMEQPGIRANLLDNDLKPKAEDEREMIFKDGELTLDYGAKVTPVELTEALKTYMDQIRGLDKVEGSGVDEDVVGQAFEDCRIIAKEARIVVEKYYNQEELDDYTERLTPVFQPIMQTLEKYKRD